MIRLAKQTLQTVGDAQRALQSAIQLEFGTLPPYLYMLYTLLPGSNAAAAERVKSIALQEMLHFCLDCNMLNAIGGAPCIADAKVVPVYPGPLPGDLGGLTLHLYPFSPAAAELGKAIETPEDGPIDYPAAAALKKTDEPFHTIGQFYEALKGCLQQLPASAWQPRRNQISDAQFFTGELFEVNSLADAERAIDLIVSEGEGSKRSPLDTEHELAHYYRFEEIARNQVLTRTPEPPGFKWGAPLGVDWTAAYPAITDPGCYDFAKDPKAARAQAACTAAFSTMLVELQRAVNGEPGRLGNAVRAMFELRMAAFQALATPLADGRHVAGPAFLFDANAARSAA